MRLLTKTFLLGLTASAALGAGPALAAPSVEVEGKQLVIRGGPDADSVGLSVPASEPNLLRVDLDGDGLPQLELPRRHFERILVEGDAGDDSVRVEAPARLRLEPIRVDGGEGHDAATLAGSDSSEEFRLSAADTRVRMTRDGGRVRLLASGLERADVPVGGGRDDLDVRDMTGTELQEVHTDLGDGQDDRLSVDGSEEQDQISAFGFAQTLFVIGPFAFVQIENAEPDDELVVDGAGNRDLVSTSSAAMKMTLRGGAASDVVLGGPGDDVLEGGEDFDDVAGRGGDDRAKLGEDFDRFTWNPGDGSDVVDGGPSRDSISFNGADAAAETVALSADGRRLRITRDVDSTVTDLGSIEEVNAVPRGGADTLRIGDLSRTPVGLVHANMAAGGSTGDGALDTVEVTGTPRADSIAVTGAGRAVDVAGLSALVELTLLDPTDRLALHTGGGNDSVDTSGLPPGIVDLVVD
jgi:Ca2+-binding RTX toxin-like protein